MIGVVLIDYSTAHPYHLTVRAMGDWSDEAQDLAERLQRVFEWDEQIELVIRHVRRRRHVLTLGMKARDKRFGVAIDLQGWRSTLYDPRMIVAAFDELVRAAMFEVRS